MTTLGAKKSFLPQALQEVAGLGWPGWALASRNTPVPMQPTADGWQIELPLAEVGYFKAKAYALDENRMVANQILRFTQP